MPRHVKDIAAAVRALRAHYGVPPPLPTTDPFELILWENVAYLAPPPERAAAFAMLRREVGTAPRAIVAASDAALESVTAHGILKARFAAKLRTCARIAIENFGGDLRSVIGGPLQAAKRALRLFPGIGEPGADKILLFVGAQAVLAPDSNALRVLVRLGFITEEPSYSRMYAASRGLGTQIAAEPGVLLEAHQLLQLHGRTLCKTTEPACHACPLAPDCRFAGAMSRSKLPQSGKPRQRRSGASRSSLERRRHRAGRPKR
jgi:endonuclease III